MHQDFKYGDAVWSQEDPKQIVIKYVPEQTRVLDIGCGNGLLGAWLKQNKHCYTVGIEGHPDGYKEAKRNLDKAYQVDVNDLERLRQMLKGQRFDVISFIDVLEHCYHPLEVLALAKQHLSPGGTIIVSLPNVAHHSIRTMLLKGKWDYQDTGIMDRTHVAFYTRTTAEALIRQAGLRVVATEHTSPKRGLWSAISRIDPTLTAVQFVVIAGHD